MQTYVCPLFSDSYLRYNKYIRKQFDKEGFSYEA